MPSIKGENLFMEEKEMLIKIQALADKTAMNFAIKRTAKLDLVYTEKLEDGSTDCYCLGADMPLLVYRVFNVKEDGSVTEYTDIQEAVKKSQHYNTEVKASLGIEKTPLIATEKNEYEIILENHDESKPGAVEIKLLSSTGRNITMIEIYRYFDFVSKVYFVSCVALSFGGQYLFSVTPDSKHLRLIVGNNPEIRSRVDMMTELLQARLLPSYKTIADGAMLLSGKAQANLTLNKGEEKIDFESTFCYDDQKTQTRFAFFAKKGNPKEGIIVIQDIFTQQYIMSNEWSEEQKAAVDEIKALMKDNQEEFNKHTTSVFTDDLDFRYNAYKNGKLQPNLPTQTTTTEEVSK